MPGGLFVTFEGVEGSGKSTLLSTLAAGLAQAGRRVIQTREPGGSALGEAVRQLVLSPEHGPVAPWSELFLMLAARAQLVEQIVRPALAAGEIVLCDRYADASVAYQGAGRGLGEKRVAELNRLATGSLAPDLTLLVDLDPEQARHRMQRPLDRMERERMEFHRAVRVAYLQLATAEPGRIVRLDGGAPPHVLAEGAWAALRDRLPGLPIILPAASGT